MEKSFIDENYYIARMMGRCSNGAERDSGSLYHAIPKSSWKALCGKAPGKRSAGWADRENDKSVNCPSCLRKLRKAYDYLPGGWTCGQRKMA
jgi:hypothetical protein